MTESKHTPGPWRACERWILPAFDQDAASIGSATVLAGKTQAYQEAFNATAYANARLMAAAPDLLSACERLLHELQRLGGNRTDKHEAMSIAAAAIEKARG